MEAMDNPFSCVLRTLRPRGERRQQSGPNASNHESLRDHSAFVLAHHFDREVTESGTRPRGIISVGVRFCGIRTATVILVVWRPSVIVSAGARLTLAIVCRRETEKSGSRPDPLLSRLWRRHRRTRPVVFRCDTTQGLIIAA